MDLLQNLYMGFSISLTPINILYCLAGCFLGQIVGVLPGIGAPTAVALLLPMTFSINPTSAIIVGAGSIVLVAAHVPHRFYSIEVDLTILVFFAPAEYSNQHRAS